MTWGRIDDKLHSHPKVERVDVAAMGLWILALSYCCDLLTDGHVTLERIKLLAKNGLKLAGQLHAVRLWHLSDERCGDDQCDTYAKPGDGYRFHDWHKYQPTRAEVEEERKRRASAGRAGGLARAKNLAAKTLAPATEVLDSGQRNVSAPVSDPSPTRPDLLSLTSINCTSDCEEPCARARIPKPRGRRPKIATSCPPSVPYAPAQAWLLEHDIPRTGAALEFLDWHVSNGKSRRDWQAAWRNWERKAATFNGHRRPDAPHRDLSFDLEADAREQSLESQKREDAAKAAGDDLEKF